MPNISSPFDVDNIPRVLCRLRNNKGRLEDYNYLQQSLLKTNVADDRSYQRKFKSFYRVRRNDVWCAIFFQILEREKRNKTVSFSNVLNEIYREARHNDRQQVEMSFASKLVATINPELPVLDKYVFENLGLKTSSNRKLNRVVEIYSEVQTLTSRKIQSNGFETWRNRFDETFPQFTHFTDVKKLDLFLWQKR